jgi:hypothetical protein
MGGLERGFKTWSEQLSLSIRRELNLAPHAPLSPLCLAEHLDVRVWTPHDVPGLPRHVLDQLIYHDPDGWSAVTCSSGKDTLIIHNPQHSPARQNSDIAHELAHIILEHEPCKLVVSHDASIVMRNFDAKQEEEANWLGWSLLLPRTALAYATKTRLSTEEIARQWKVSTQLVNFRTKMTGVQQQYKRAIRV